MHPLSDVPPPLPSFQSVPVDIRRVPPTAFVRSRAAGKTSSTSILPLGQSMSASASPVSTAVPVPAPTTPPAATSSVGSPIQVSVSLSSSVGAWEAARPARRQRSSVKTERLFDDVVSADLEEFEDWFKRTLQSNPQKLKPVIVPADQVKAAAPVKSESPVPPEAPTAAGSKPVADEELSWRLKEQLAKKPTGKAALRHKSLIPRTQSAGVERVVDPSRSMLSDDLSWGSPVATNLDFGMLLERQDCKDIRAMIDSFVKNFEKQTRGNADEEARTVRSLLTSIEATMKARPVWSRLTPNHFVIAKEEMHKFVFAKLFPTVFVKKEYQVKDASIKSHIEKIRPVLTPQFLDLKKQFYESETLSAAVRELELLDVFVTPFEKLMCIFNCCRILIFILQTGGSSAGADDFLPLFIFVVLQADLRALQSNMEYISRYVDPEEKFGEAYCYFTHLVSAVTYLATLEPGTVLETLKQKQAEAEARAKEPPKQASPPPQAAAKQQSPAPEASGSPGSVEREDREFLDGLRFLDAAADQLLPADVVSLLAEYKKLADVARRYVPRVAKVPTWGQEALITSSVIELPAGSKVMSLLVCNGYVWAGLESGRVSIARIDKAEMVCSLPVHTTGVSALAFVPPNVWCASRRGSIFLIDPSFLSIGAKLALNDQAHTEIISIVHCEAEGLVWVAAVAPSPKRETQLVAVQPSATVPCRSVIVPSVASQLGNHMGSLWVAFSDGTLSSFSAKTGEHLRSLGPLHSASHPLSMGLASPTAESLWIATGESLRVLDGDSSSVVAVETQGLCGPVLAICSTSLPWGADGARCDVVISASTAGSVCVWNASDRTCEAALTGGPAFPQAIAASPSSPGSGSATVWAAAEEHRLFFWVYDRPTKK